MKPSSCKAKGRVLQDWVKAKLIEVLDLVPDDIKTAIMGENGTDVRLFGENRKKFPFSIECKNTERLSLWTAWSQAVENCEKDTNPILFVKKNRKKPLVVMDAETFLELYAGVSD